MEQKEWLALPEKNQIEAVVGLNQKTEKFGLALTEEEARQLVLICREKLKEQQRVEFGEGILPKLIWTFCDSPYIDQNTYIKTISRLQEIFYFYKNESMDEFTDDELLEYMKKAFDGECNGSLEYLEETVLEDFARNIRREGHSFFGSYYRRGGYDE